MTQITAPGMVSFGGGGEGLVQGPLSIKKGEKNILHIWLTFQSVKMTSFELWHFRLSKKKTPRFGPPLKHSWRKPWLQVEVHVYIHYEYA